MHRTINFIRATNTRMRYFFNTVVLLCVMTKTLAQTTPARYRDSLFSPDQVLTVAYGNNLDYINERDTLKADIYQPANDTAENRAMIIYMHGGGFMSGHRNDPAVQELCTKLASRGYVTASIDYRLGANAFTKMFMFDAAIRAVQDLNGFIRYAKANAAAWRIDTNKIFITGSSAGAIAVLAKAYIKIDDVARQFGITSMEQLEGNTNDLTNTSSVAGAYSMWGAVFDTSWIQSGDIPVGCVHSISDSTVPFNVGYNRKNRSLLLYGSLPVYKRALNQGIITTLHGYESGQHDLGLKVAPYKDTTVQLMCNFFYQLLHPEMRQGSLLEDNKGMLAYYENLSQNACSEKNNIVTYIKKLFVVK